MPKAANKIHLQIVGEVNQSVTIRSELASLPRVELVSDFHCVTTWSHKSLRWGGYRFRDFYNTIVVPQAGPSADATILLLKGQDGARTTLLLKDALHENVLLADRLNGAPLSVEHGGPLRFVAPSHYGYKSMKYLCKIECCSDYSRFRPAGFGFMDHPRARVELEERGKGLPGWVFRFLYRPLVRPTIKLFEKATNERSEAAGRG